MTNPPDKTDKRTITRNEMSEKPLSKIAAGLAEATGYAKGVNAFSEELAKKGALIAELVKALEPFASIKMYGDYGGPLVGLSPFYEDGSKGRHLAHEAVSRARTAINKAKGT